MLTALFTGTMLLLSSCTGSDNGVVDLDPADSLKIETVAIGLSVPWSMVWGPDGNIWFTERSGKIKRFNVTSKEVTVIGDVPNVLERSESGLMGIALHPDWKTSPYIYVVHSYSAGGNTIKNRLVRMKYENQKLGTPEILIDTLAGSGIHNGSRLLITPDRFLYVTTGDAGNLGLPQNKSNLSGKVLRLTLDGKKAADNPFQNEVWSYGHRNAQGLAFNPRSKVLYVSEHGPGTDDEINVIVRAANYGWPDVHGKCDNNVPNEKEFCTANKVVEPIADWTPTIAPAGIAVYQSAKITGWDNSLLLTSLKGSTLHRLQLSKDGKKILKQDVVFTTKYGRLRDVLVAPNGDVYVSTSNKDGRGRPSADDDRIIRISR